MKYLLRAAIALSLTSAAFGSVKMIADIKLNKETIKLDQTVEEDQIYTFTANESLINIIVPKSKTSGQHNFKFKAFKRKNLDLVANGDGEIIMKDGQEATMSMTDKKSKEEIKLKITIQGNL